MATPTELYINAELPKRPYTAQYPLTAGHVPVATGVGLEVAARQLDVTDVANAASETYVDDAINALVDGAPAALDTLNELAAAINDDANYASTVTTALGNRLRVDVNTQGLTNTEKQNGLDNLGITEVITDASVDASGLITFTKNTGQTADTVQIPTALNDLTFNSTTGVLTLKHTNSVADSAITITSNEIADDVFRVKDNVDGTKKIAFEASGLSTGATRTITMPNTNVDLGQIPYIQLIDQSITYDFANVPSDAKYTKYVISASCIPTINLAAFTSRTRQIEVFNASNDVVSLTLLVSGTIKYSSGDPLDFGNQLYLQPGTSIVIGMGKNSEYLVSASKGSVAIVKPAAGSIAPNVSYAKLVLIGADNNFTLDINSLSGLGFTVIAAKANCTITLTSGWSLHNLATNSTETSLVLNKGEIAYIFPDRSFVRIAEKNQFYTSAFRLKESGSSLMDPPPYADNTVGFAFGFDWLFNAGVNRTITIPNKNIDLSNIGRVPGYTNPTAYVTGDVVAYNGQEFRCRTTHTSSTAEPDYTKFTPVSGTLHITNTTGLVFPPANPEIRSLEVHSQSTFTLYNTDTTTYPIKIVSTGNGITVSGSPSALTKDGITQDIVLGYAESATVTNGNRWSAGVNEFTDSVFRIKDNASPTKKIAFEASGITAATTRTITMPDRNVDLGKIVENVSVNGGIYTIPVGANQRLVCTDGSSQTINADALVGTQNICQVVSSGGAPIFIYQNGTAVWKNEQEQTITSFTLYYGESATLMDIAGSVYVLKNGVLNSSFSLLSNNRTTKVNFDLNQLPNSVTRSITMPNVNVNLGNPYIGASFSTSNGYLTLNRVSGVDTYINLNPDPTIVSTNYTLESGKVYALGHPSFGVLDPMTQLVANVTLTLPAPQKAIKIYVGNYKGTITFAGATVYSPEGASITSFYPTPGSILEFVIGDPGTFIPGFYTWTLFEQQNGIYEAADFKLIKNNNQDFGVTFNLSNITGNKIITMPNASADLGQIPATHTSNGNSVTGSYGAIVNGLTNTASGQYSAVLNGTLNTASGKHGIVISGQSNTAKIDQVIINGRNITGIETTGAVIRGGIVEGVGSTSDALGTTVAEYTLRGGVASGVTNWILANGSTNAAMSAAVTTVSSIKATLSTTTNPYIVNACGIHDVTFMIIGSSGSPKPIFAGQRRVMVYYNGTTYTMEPVQTIGTDYTIGGATSTLTIGLTPTAPLGLLTFAVANNEANNVMVNISVRSTYNNYQ